MPAGRGMGMMPPSSCICLIFFVFVLNFLLLVGGMPPPMGFGGPPGMPGGPPPGFRPPGMPPGMPFAPPPGFGGPPPGYDPITLSSTCHTETASASSLLRNKELARVVLTRGCPSARNCLTKQTTERRGCAGPCLMPPLVFNFVNSTATCSTLPVRITSISHVLHCKCCMNCVFSSSRCRSPFEMRRREATCCSPFCMSVNIQQTRLICITPFLCPSLLNSRLVKILRTRMAEPSPG
jgi:hypothetical protein